MIGEYIANIYDPRLADAIDHLIHNDDPIKKEILFKYYLDQVKLVDIGDPRATKNKSVEELKQHGIVGLYKSSNTTKTVISFFGGDSIYSDKKCVYEPENKLYDDSLELKPSIEDLII